MSRDSRASPQEENTDLGKYIEYPFTLDFPATTGLSGIAVGGQEFPLQDSLFVAPTLSSIEPGLAEYNILDPTHLFTFNITAAVSDLISCASRLKRYARPLLKLRLSDYVAPLFPPARHPESHLRDSRSATREYEPEDRLFNHG